MIDTASSWMSRAARWGRANLVSQQADYVAADSLVNKVRGGGAGAVAVGAGLGAAAGATAGFVSGLQHLAADRVTVQTQVLDIGRPVLVGAHYVPESQTWNPTFDGNGNLSGGYYTYYDAYWNPIVRNDSVGTYSQQHLAHTMSWGPASGAAVGLAGGAAVGALGGLLVTLVSRAMRDDAAAPAPRVPASQAAEKAARLADHAPLIGAALGTAVGAVAGYAAGQMAESRTQVLTQTVMKPDLRPETIGFIPHANTVPREYMHGYNLNYAELPQGRFGATPFEGARAVVRDVPTGTSTPTQVTEKSHSLNTVNGVLIGAGIGMGSGFLGGVAAGILIKMAAREDPQP